jgi:hypothetical protein
VKLQDYIVAHLSLMLFGAKAGILWVLANYTYPADPVAEICAGSRVSPRWRWGWLSAVLVRSAVLGCLITWISGWSFGLGAFTLILSVLLPLARSRIAPGYLAEFEIGANLAYLFGVIYLSVLLATPSKIPHGSEPASGQLAAASIVAAIVIFVLRGGTYIVRGVLEKGKTLPERRVQGAGGAGLLKEVKLDVAEYNRGRIIGNIERVILLAFVAMQAYQALAFLITAKGLFRAKDLEHAEFAEYFLVGTLASSLVAIAAGLAIQFVLKLLW